MSLRDTPKHEKAPKFRRESWACRNIGVFSEQDSTHLRERLVFPAEPSRDPIAGQTGSPIYSIRSMRYKKRSLDP
jgi:hypothetical protein